MKKRKILSVLLASIVFAALTLSCMGCKGNNSGTSNEPSILLQVDSFQLEEDARGQLKAEFENLTEQVVWTSSDETVVSVDKDGWLLAKKVGTAVITASANGKSDSCTVQVTAAPALSNLQIQGENSYFLALEEGAAEQNKEMRLEVFDGEEKKENAIITFKSLDENVVTVDKNGVLNAVAVGSTVVEATCEDVICSINVDVYHKYVDSAEDWNKMAEARQKHYLITADIDFGGVVYTAAYNGWVYDTKNVSDLITKADEETSVLNDVGTLNAIRAQYPEANLPEYKKGDKFTQENAQQYIDVMENAPKGFTGRINGNGHTIKNVHCSGTDSMSLFGTVMGSAVIENCNFYNIQYDGVAMSAGFAMYTNGSLEMGAPILRNLSLDVRFKNKATADVDSDSRNAGVVYRAIRGSFENIVLSLTTPNGTPKTDGVDVFCVGSYYDWSDNSLFVSNFFAYTGTEDVVMFNQRVSSAGEPKTSGIVKAYRTKIALAFDCQKILNGEFWKKSDTEMPYIGK